MFFTEINTEDVVSICEKEKNVNNLKILLANEATKILHGEVASKKAEQTAKDTFEKGGLGADLPEIKINYKKIQKGINILDLIVENKILHSKGDRSFLDLPSKKLVIINFLSLKSDI